MVHWPKTIVANVVTIAIALIAGLALIQSAIALSGSFVWISLAVAALVVFVAVVVHRRAQAASDLALADAPSFADVLPQWNSRRDLEAARLGRPVELGSTPPSSAEKAGDAGVGAVASV
jgi:membrane glycosyltransferase